MAEPATHPGPPVVDATVPAPWRRLDPSEIPPEFAGNAFVRGLTTLTPEDERMLERAAELDRRDP